MTDRFVTAADEMRRVLGLPDYPFAVIEHPISSASNAALGAAGGGGPRPRAALPVGPADALSGLRSGAEAGWAAGGAVRP